MNGISSKALKSNYAENKYKFNGGNELQSNEFSDGSGLDTYDANFRFYDPQIGRFNQIDRLAESSYNWSPYNFASNNPILRNDPLGLKDSVVNGEHVQATVTGQEAKVYSKGAKINYYWYLRNNEIPITRVKNEVLFNWLWRYDENQRFLEKIHHMQREQDLWIYGTFFAPLLIELNGTLIYQGGQVLVRIGSRLLPLERISALYNDVCLRLWFGGNTILNGLKGDLLAAIAGTFFKNNPAMWDKLMKQSEQFSELMKPIIDQLQKWNEKNPHGGPVKTLNRLAF